MCGTGKLHFKLFRYVTGNEEEVGLIGNWILKVELRNDSNQNTKKGVNLKRIKFSRSSLIHSANFVPFTLPDSTIGAETPPKKKVETASMSLRQYTAVVTILVVFWILTTVILSLMFVKQKTKNNDLKDAIETYRRMIPKGGNEILLR